ncbi:hypothetical protein GCM10009850_116140 [Nonomuraea monospora]|uniref:Uncharacterized protein n=1 Tax=Nonomuraea monospora TaxID=568818 RepID=A0ABN3D2X5_9ACTN
MAFWARTTEDDFEKWFQAKFDQWIAERLGTEIDQRVQAWLGNEDDRLQEGMRTHFDAQFDSRCNKRIKAWQDRELKKGFDAWVTNWFDNLFTVYANTWADSAGFQERFDQRFKAVFEESLENAVRARVANEISGQIDRRIEVWLIAARKDLLDAAGSGGNPAVTPLLTAAPEPEEEIKTATAGQLAHFLEKGPLQPRRIRKLLKGLEIPGTRPAAYPVKEAAAALLLRRGRRSKDPGDEFSS